MTILEVRVVHLKDDLNICIRLCICYKCVIEINPSVLYIAWKIALINLVMIRPDLSLIKED